MNGQDDRCQAQKATVANLQAEIATLEQSLGDLADEGINPDPVLNEIKRLRLQLHGALHALAECLAQPITPPPSAPKSNLSVPAVEPTQAIQIVTADRGYDNYKDVPMIAGKTTVIRVYLYNAADPTLPSIRTVTGRLSVVPFDPAERPHSSWLILPYNGPIIPPGPHDSFNRDNPNYSLNFRLPTEACAGIVDTVIAVWDPASTSNPVEVSGPRLIFLDAAPLKVRLVRIAYKNAARRLDVPAPTLADFLTMAERTIKMYPVPGLEIVRESEALATGDFTDWSEMIALLQRLHQAEDPPSDVAYVGVTPSAPANQTGDGGFTIGNDGYSVAAFEVGNELAMAHEIGHILGRIHTACAFPLCGNPGMTDPTYPTYPGLPMGSIGEFGFDVMQNVTFDPARTTDFMSYCCGNPQWVSLYGYGLFFEYFRGLSGGAPPWGYGPVAAADAQGEALNTETETCRLRVRIYRDGSLDLPAFSFHAPSAPRQALGPPTPYFVELHDSRGRPLEAQRLRMGTSTASLDDAYLDFDIGIAWHEDAARVVFKHNQQVIGEIDVGNTVPLTVTAPRANEKVAGEYRLTWQAKGARKLAYVVRFSADDGATWRALGTDLQTKELVVDFNELAGGDSCRFEVWATTGVRTTKARSDAFVVSRKNPAAVIAAPREGQVFLPGDPVVMLGAGLAEGGSSITPDGLTWSSNLNGHLGTGAYLAVNHLDVGAHDITFSVADDDGKRSVGSVGIRIVKST